MPAEPHLDFDDVVVDDYADVQWRLRALYGLKNARGTRMLALGGTDFYSRPARELSPAHARDVWGYEMITVSPEELRPRLERVRADAAAVQEAERQAAELIALPNVALETDRRFVVNTFLALRVIRELMEAHQCTNLGVANCMGGLIPVLDTPPCLALSLLNDAGLTAFCHTDFTHTLPGVLLRWISHKPSFVCNSHFPHHGVLTLAHCAAPRKMNGRDFEPTTLMTHYESDYGAATKVEYRRGQVITCLIPNLRCTKWFGFRARITDSPSFDMCRSQMDIEIEGDWRALTREMEGFHTVVCLRRLPGRGGLRLEEGRRHRVEELQPGGLRADLGLALPKLSVVRTGRTTWGRGRPRPRFPDARGNAGRGRGRPRSVTDNSEMHRSPCYLLLRARAKRRAQVTEQRGMLFEHRLQRRDIGRELRLDAGRLGGQPAVAHLLLEHTEGHDGVFRHIHRAARGPQRPHHHRVEPQLVDQPLGRAGRLVSDADAPGPPIEGGAEIL